MAQRARSGLSFYGRKTFSSLQSRAYRIYFFGMLGQFASMNMQMVTGSLLLYRLTGSAALLGTMSLAHAVPMLILSLFGGAIADRMDKKQILYIGLAFSAAISLGVAVSLDTGILSKENTGSWWILMVSALCQGTVMGLMLPARQAIIPEIVTKDQLMNAVALNTLGMNVLRLAAPAAAGYLVHYFDFESVYYTMTAMNIYATIFILFVPPSGQKLPAGPGNIMAQIRDGLNYIRKDSLVMLILGFTLFLVLLSMPYQTFIPIYVDDILKVGAIGQGMLFSVSGAGAVIGSLALAAAPNKRRGYILIMSGLVSGLSLVVFAFSRSWMLSLIFVVFVGLGQTARGTVSNALLQTYVDGAYMGRVMSIFMMEWGLVSVVTFFGGLMAEAIPVQWVVGGFAVLLVAICIVVAFAFPRLRKLD